MKLLLNRGFLYRSPSGTLLPYAVEKNNELFIVKDYFNNGHLGSQTLVTPKGKETGLTIEAPKLVAMLSPATTSRPRTE